MSMSMRNGRVGPAVAAPRQGQSAGPQPRTLPTIDLTDRAGVPAPDEAAPGTEPPSDGLDPDGVLRACVRTLVGLAYRTPGFDVSVSSGPDHSWALRLHHSGDGLRAQLLRAVAGTGEGPQVELTPSPAELEAELATLLWSPDREPVR
jgi:hypothetical protein